jgi:4-amino-4-deoxy-L-arabinose transferase-like glycosyltransferase
MHTALDHPGKPTAPERLPFALLLIGTAVVYCWNISVNGWANPFYAAAVQAGSRDWRSWFFGSLDSENFITVDKPPASLWLMGLSGRVFGFSSTSMLIPQAMLAVATAAVLYFAVRRVAGHGSGLVAGAVFALTPAVAVIFRYNNPDALMVFLMALGGFFLVRALAEERSKAATWWLAACGSALGFAFLAKMLEGLIVLPAFGLACLVAGHGSTKARFGRLLVAAGALVASAGWWVLVVALTPSSARPYVGGSTDDTEMDLVLGYNGLQRVLGGGKPHWSPRTSNGRPAHRMSEMMSQRPGIGRLFTGDIASQIDWLLPTALIALLLGLWLRGRAPRTDLTRASHILWGGWLLIGFFLFSFMNHGMHTYYVVALAPPIAATIGTTLGQLWQRNDRTAGKTGCAALALSAGVTAFALLNRNPSWHPPLRWAVLAATILAVTLLLLPRTRNSDRLRAAAAGLALLVGVSGGGAYVLATVVSPKTGGSPSAGPNLGDGRATAFQDRLVTATPDLVALLHGAGTQWSAAVERSSSAANLELASDTAVMAIGGFTGADPMPKPDEFIDMAKAGKVRYFVNRVPDEDDKKDKTQHEAACEAENPVDPAHCDIDTNNVGPKIEAWVKAHAPAPAVLGNVEVYDLSTLQP